MKRYIKLRNELIDNLMHDRWNMTVYELLFKTINEGRKDARRKERLNHIWEQIPKRNIRKNFTRG